MSGENDPPVNEDIEQLLQQVKSEAGAQPAAHSGDDSLQANEIESLLAANQAASAGKPSQSASGQNRGGDDSDAADADSLAGEDLQMLFDQAEQALASVDAPVPDEAAGIQNYNLRDFSGAPASTEKATLELLRDVELDLRIELGRTHMYLEDVLKLRRGSVVALDKLAGDPVDIIVNGRLIARGEVLVLNDNFCIRVAELFSGDNV